MTLSFSVFASLLGGCDSEGADRAPVAVPAPWRNHLAAEASPYLQLHAENPVDWYPWGDEALQRAQAEQKLIFLSVGYTTCYWCHVMEREVFSNPEIAAQMNEHFISIKVDREERPDIDEIYMTATQMLTGSGGWPNSVFLTPEGRPFFAGTYFPARDSPGRRGFPTVLRGMHDAWVNRRETVLAAARELTEKLALAVDGSPERTAPPSPGESASAALRGLRRDFDSKQGGFGRHMKFPRAPVLDLLVTKLEQERDPETEQMLVRTLDAMAAGGIYDQLGGGFHRYSTERSWSIPHFEKMLYDNAQLAGIYARAFALTRRPLYRRIAEQTLAYLDREMSHPEGGFYSAQDAEVDGREGASYVWTRAEIDDVLGATSSEAFFGVYELVPLPGEPDHGVLRVRSSLPELLKENRGTDLVALVARFDSARRALLQRRSTRPQPLRDEKVLAEWNGLAIRGLVEAARALDRPDYGRRAERVASFVLARLGSDDGSLRRSYVAGQAREQGVLDDYASVADGLLALHRATGDPRWRDESARLADVLLARFADEANGGFFLTQAGSSLLVRPKPFQDNELPSGNAQALRVLRQLAIDPGAERYANAAAGIESATAPLLLRAPDALSASVAARILARESSPTGSARASGAGVSPPPSFPRSRDHLRAELARRDSSRAHLAVRIKVDPGWHVNANPATHAYLVATAVEIPNRERPAEIRYPRGRPFRPELAPSAIDVYEGEFEIELDLEAELGPADPVALRFQACDTNRCLPPDRVELHLE